jgi:hypothetical protein
MSRRLDGGSPGAEVPALPAPKHEGLRRRRTAVLLLLAACVVVFFVGVLSGWVNRNHTICGKGKIPLSQRSDFLGNTEFRCPGGRTVTVSS